MTLGIARYGLATFRWSLRRLAIFALVLVLAIALLFSQELASNMAAGQLLEQRLSSVPYDLEAQTSSLSPDSAASGLAQVGSVMMSTYAFFVAYFAQAKSAGGLASQTWIAGVAPNFGLLASDVGWQGSFTLPPGGAVLSSAVAASLRVSVGDPVSVGDEVCDSATQTCEFRNLTYTVTAILRVDKAGSQFNYPFMIFLAVLDGETLYATITGQPFPNGGFNGPAFSFLIWLNRNETLRPLDPQGNLQRVARIERDVEVALGTNSVSSPLVDALKSYSDGLAPLQGTFLALAVPAVILAFALALATLEKAAGSPLSQLRLLRIRGLTQRQALCVLTLPAIVAAGIAVFVVVLVSPLMAEELSYLIRSQDGNALRTSWPGSDGSYLVPLSVGLLSILIILVLYVHQMAGQLSRPHYKWHRAWPESEPHNSLLADYVLLSIGLMLWGYIAFYQFISTFVPELITLLGGLLSVLAPIASVAVVTGAVRPLLRRRKLLLGVGRAVSAPCGRLARQYMPGRVSLISPRARMPLIVALTMALVLMGFIGQASEHAYNVEQSKALVGGDMSVDATTNRTFLEHLTGLPAVETGTEIELFPPFLATPGPIVLFNASSYQEVVGSDAYFFSDIGGSVKPLVLGGPRVVINVAAARQGGLHIGDRFLVTHDEGGNRTSAVVEVTGVVKTLPGLLPYGLAHVGDPLVYGDLDNFYKALFPRASSSNPMYMRFLLHVRLGTDSDSLRNEVLDQFPGTVTAVVVSAQALVGRQPTATDIVGAFLWGEAYLTFALVLLAVGGMGLTLFSEERDEIATLRVRGARRRSVTGLIWGEVAVPTLLGLALGVAVGLCGSWFFLDALSKLADVSVLNRPWTVDLDSVLPALFFATALLILLAGIAWNASEPDVSLSVRGGVP